MRYLLLSGAVVAAVGLYLLAGASADTTLFARHYPWLLALNATLAGLFAIMVVVQLFALARRYRAREFGTRLTLRLLGRFAVLAVVPGMIVYGVSVQFLARSIESWFDVKVDAALEGGINLGRQAIDQRLAELQDNWAYCEGTLDCARARGSCRRPPSRIAQPAAGAVRHSGGRAGDRIGTRAGKRKR